ncbi:hypothetical protein VTN77DRAFT_1297 [Rasamsonia byssochlamydoides]|uniref:uncharacterized protein n=1 Tax=Rasamsonia byssochlamydoides TaxID=89139 RepID=UPI0037438E6F
MQKRAILRLCRCQPIDSARAVRNGRKQLPPSRRYEFHTSSRVDQSGQATAAANEEDSVASRSSLPRKFGGGWGAGLSRKTSGLSASEEASRQAILAATKGPEQSLQSKESEEPKESRIGGWGGGLSRKTSSLSTSEKASRQAVLSATQGPEQSSQSKESEESRGGAWEAGLPRKTSGLSTSEEASSQDISAATKGPEQSSQSKESEEPKESRSGGWGAGLSRKTSSLSTNEEPSRQAILSATQGPEQSSPSKESEESKESRIRGWGGGLLRKTSGLSASEEASRQAILSAKQGPEQSPQSKESKESREPKEFKESKESRIGGWGAGLSRRTFGLSASEEASRQAILSATREPEQSSQSKEDSNAPSGSSDDPLTIVTNRANPYRSGQPGLRPRKRLQPGNIAVPPHLRAEDWDCPECRFRCFGKHAQCPCCHTTRPELLPAFKRVDLSEQNITIRKLAQSVLTDWQEGKLDDPGSDRTGLSAREKAMLEHANRRANSEARDESRSQTSTEASSEEPSSRSWRWMDPSEEEVDVQSQKSSKRPKNTRQQESEFEDEEYDEDEIRRRREERKRKKKLKEQQKEADAAPSPLYLPEFISVINLADVLGVRPAQFVARMEEMGFEGVTYNHVLDAETAGLIASEYNFEPIFEKDEDDLVAAPEPEDKSVLPPRPPVVTIMGHVDHGKTTILDWLRKSSIAASEHGGITQHIGAFSVSMPSGKTITFLDTPGHAAFLDMRRRGANMTDIVVLVVAADDSVKPQTVEAIKHAKEADVPIIVAINKIDKDNVNPERVKQDLARHSVDVEDYGGDVQAICVSGKTGQGMLELEEAIVTLSELLDHRAPIDGNAEGWVVEATTKKVGRVATVLVRRGTLRPGDIIVAGTTWARIRTLKNEHGVAINEATPGMPVEIDGWKEQPEAGAEVLQAPSEQKAKDVVAYRLEKTETQKLSEDMAAINESRKETLEKRRREEAQEEEGDEEAEEAASGPRPINFLIKADVSGSAEALVNSVSAIGNNEIFAHILRSGVGPITEFDVKHAAMADANIISFNMTIDPNIQRMAETQGVRILNHNIIYELIDDVKAKMSEHLPPAVSQRVTGEAEIGQIFHITVKGRETTAIAGCKVRNGVISRAKKVRVLRGKEVIYDGAIASLKNVKKDVTEMRKDTECGMGFEGWTDFAVGDHVQCYEEIYEKRYL